MSDEKFLVDDAGGVKEVSVESKESTLESTISEVGKPEKKKRGRKPKEPTVREFNCATCLKMVSELNVMKIGAGEERFAIFCPNCQKSLGFIQPDVDTKIDLLLNKNNPNK